MTAEDQKGAPSGEVFYCDKCLSRILGSYRYKQHVQFCKAQFVEVANPPARPCTCYIPKEFTCEVHEGNE